MNLELLEISVAATRGFTFETIWPFILYVFNNWVKHQVTLMGVKAMLTKVDNWEGGRQNVNLQYLAHRKDLLDDLEAIESEPKYVEMLNFSSEIEFDDRFVDEKNEH